MRTRNSGLSILLMGLVYAFLYAPIFFMVLFSFNASSAMTRWDGFSWQWYQALLSNKILLSGVLTSLQVATVSATLAVILGTLNAVILVRFPSFRGKSSLGLMATAPLVMPEVITGLALLTFFVTTENMFGWPAGRGVYTIIIAHTTLSLAYVTVMIRSRLLEVDRSIEEAALDLGARPHHVFALIVLPVIAPSLLASWLLAFALSMDDLVIASFTAGPGSSTLPMVIFSSIRMGTTPEINAMATLIIVIVTVCVIGISLLIHKHRFRS